jgi:replicative DNA helicase
MDYLTKKVLDLSQEEQRKIMSALVEKLAADPVTRSDKYDIRLMSDYTDEARIRLQNWGKVQGIRTGYGQLDEMTKGLVGGELIIVAGKTSHGKTTLAMNIANNVALAGHTVLFVTLGDDPRRTHQSLHVHQRRGNRRLWRCIE